MTEEESEFLNDWVARNVNPSRDRIVLEVRLDAVKDPIAAGRAVAEVVKALSALHIAMGGNGLLVESSEALELWGGQHDGKEMMRLTLKADVPPTDSKS